MRVPCSAATELGQAQCLGAGAAAVCTGEEMQFPSRGEMKVGIFIWRAVGLSTA